MTSEQGQSPGVKPAVVLVRPQEEGNVGAAARAMANMGLEQLILVEPAATLGGVARGFGVGGWHILDRIKRCSSLEEALAPFHRVVGSTSGRERRLVGQRVLAPQELSPYLEASPAQSALVFGSEANGLSREELAQMAAVVTIPAVAEHPTLNLAQAVLILAYELRAGSGCRPAQPEEPLPSSVDERTRLLSQVRELLQRVQFGTADRQRSTMRQLTMLTARADLSVAEVRLLRKIGRHLNPLLELALEARPREHSAESGGDTVPGHDAAPESQEPASARSGRAEGVDGGPQKESLPS